MHGWLLIPFTAKYSPGWYIVSAMSIPLMGSLITGLVVYKKFWRGFLRPRLRVARRLAHLLGRPSPARRPVVDPVHRHHQRHRDVVPDRGGDCRHRLQIARRDRASARCAPHMCRLAPRAQATQAVSVDQAIAIARESFPGMTTAFVELPMSAYDPIEIFGRGAYPLVFEIAYISPYSGKVLAARGIGDRSDARPRHREHAAAAHRRFRRAVAEARLFAFRPAAFNPGVFRHDGLDQAFGAGDRAVDIRAAQASGRRGRAWSRGVSAPGSAASGVRRIWRRWWFHLGALMVLVPAIYLKSYLDLQAMFIQSREEGLRATEIIVGPWKLQLQERGGGGALLGSARRLGEAVPRHPVRGLRRQDQGHLHQPEASGIDASTAWRSRVIPIDPSPT